MSNTRAKQGSPNLSEPCGVCGSDDSQHGESVLARADYAPNWTAEHLGASSRRPRHPFPALMGGVSPAVYLCTRPEKRHTSGHVINLSKTMPTAGPHRNCTVWTSQGTCVAQQRACEILVEELRP